MANEIKHVEVNWTRGLQFEGGEPGGPQVLVDGTNQDAPGPMLQLLVALAACTGADVVSMLEKMRVDLTGLRQEVRGTRAEEDPRRFLTVHIDYYIEATNLDETKARRAIDLSMEKYCSVTHSLRLDEPVTYALHLE
jgi:putative redox protein